MNDRSQRARGSTLRTTLNFVERKFGSDVRRDILDRLPSGERRIHELPLTAEIPFDRLLRLWDAADAVLSGDAPNWIERSGAFSIASAGERMYAGILHKNTPLEFLTQRISLFRLYYQPGNMEVVASRRGTAVLRLIGFDPGSRLFCRRQTGGLTEVVRAAGGTEIEARHVRCSLDGDAFCEWSLSWSENAPPKVG